MEALVVVGAFSAIVTIVIEFDRVRKRVKRCARTLKYAKKEFEEMTEGISVFIDSMDLFRMVGSQHKDLDSCLRIKASELGAKIAKSGSVSIAKIKTLLDDVHDLREDKQASRRRYILARWRWRTKKAEIWPILQYLDSVKISAMFVIEIIHLDLTLKNKFTTGSRLSEEDKNEISRYKRRIRTLKQECRELSRENSRLRQDLEQPELADMTREVIATARQLIDNLIQDRPDIGIALHQAPDRLEQYWESMSATTSTVSGSDSGLLPVAPPGPTPTNGPPDLAEDAIIREAPAAGSHLDVSISIDSPRPETDIWAASGASETPSRVSTNEEQIVRYAPPRILGVPTALWPTETRENPENQPLPAEEHSEGFIVRDRNDGRGPVIEFGHPRRSHSHGTQRSRGSQTGSRDGL